MRLIDSDAFEKQINKYVEYNDDGKQEINADAVFITLHDQPTIEVNQDGDLISRQAAIDEIKKWLKFDGYNVGERNVMGCTIQMLEGLPTIDIDLSQYSDKLGQLAYERGKAERKRGEWIPCSERLPEKQVGSYLITIDDGWVGEAEYHGTFWIQYRWSANIPLNKVLAWMPLPEPYKEDTKE